MGSTGDPLMENGSFNGTWFGKIEEVGERREKEEDGSWLKEVGNEKRE